MIQALINATIIWLGSLLVYELLLKQTTFHRLNRWYMLLTFLAGIVLPLLPWRNNAAIRMLTHNAAGVPSPIPASPSGAGIPGLTEPTTSVDWILLLYIAGVVMMLVVLLRDLWRIRGLYRDALISKEGRWVIAETGANHSPFSFLNIIFISDRSDYSDAQWRMLASHEQQHFRSGHLIDLILVQSAVILLWFHPLVYVYRSRIKLLHEYEVDSLQDGDTISYGRFLLDQAACQPMAMTHALNYSPLKNRISMMTKQASTGATRVRFLLLLPLMSCAIWCCTKNQEKVAIDVKDRYAMRQDAKIVYPEARGADTITMIDPVTGKENMMVMTIEPRPEKLGDQTILERMALQAAPQCKTPGPEFGIGWLIERSGIEPILEKMPDGEYFMAISDIIVDANGRVAYFMNTLPENHRETTPGPGGMNKAKSNGLSDADKAEIQKKLAETLIAGEVSFSTTKNAKGGNAPYYLGSEGDEPAFGLRTTVVVKDHKVSYAK